MALNYDKVIFVPSKASYIKDKQHKEDAFTDQERLQMLLSLKKSRPWMEVSDYEILQDEQPRTYKTLLALKKMTGMELSLLIGTDKLSELETKWKNVDKICLEFSLTVLARKEDDPGQIIKASPFLSGLQDHIQIVASSLPYKDISSSLIREKIRQGNEDYKNLLPSGLSKEINGIIQRRQKMKNTYVLIGNAVSEMKVADVSYNLEAITALVKANRECGILLFPELCLTGYTCGDLFFQSSLLSEALKALASLKKTTADIKGLTLIVGLPIKYGNALYDVAAFLSEGHILGLVPKINIPNYGEFYEQRWFASGKDIIDKEIEIDNEKVPFGSNLIFQDSQSGVKAFAEICEDLWVVSKPSNKALLAGANIILNPSASDETICKADYRRSLVQNQSGAGYCAYVYASSSSDESSTDLVFSGHQITALNGRILNEAIFPAGSRVLKSVIDLEEIESNRIHQTTYANDTSSSFRFLPAHVKNLGDKEEANNEELLVLLKAYGYPISRFPFVPISESEKKKRCLEIMNIQARGLVKRVRSSSLYNLVIGVSGGLDSTLALLVCAQAKAIEPKIHILAFTLPNKGNTSSLTYSNATRLMSLVGDEGKEISIEKSVSQHLADIGHAPSYQGEGDTAYENAQARMRTYILMDEANMLNGLVVGTGDLSELALGWCTYNGDHMSMYDVNSSIPKTLVQFIIKAYAEDYANEELKKVLISIINTPISPELTPNSNGRISQKTEEKIGKYDLNDFFLFYFLRYGYGPKKILLLASLAYPELDKDSIRQSALRFYTRFFAMQFKRSCLPDGPKVGSITLSPRGDFRMPSDASSQLFLSELEKA